MRSKHSYVQGYSWPSSRTQISARSSKLASSGRIRTLRGYTATRRRFWWPIWSGNTLITIKWIILSLSICLRHPWSKPKTYKFHKTSTTSWRDLTWKYRKITSPSSCKWRSKWGHSNTKSNKCNHKLKSYSKPRKFSSKHNVTRIIRCKVKTLRPAVTARPAPWCSNNSNYFNRKRQLNRMMTNFRWTMI